MTAQPVITAAQQKRMQAIGAFSQLQANSVQDRSSSETKRERVSSRQAIADRSRVSTPASSYPRFSSEPDDGFRRPQATQRTSSTANAAGHTRTPYHGSSMAQPQARGPFDTDSEAADETTHHSAMTEPENTLVSRKDSFDNKAHAEGLMGSHGVPAISQESLAPYALDRGAGAQSLSLSKAGSVHDGDDEFEDQTQYEKDTPNENRNPDRGSSVESSTSASRKRKAYQPRFERGQMFGDSSDTPHEAKVSRHLASAGPQASRHPLARSNRTVSISSREDDSDLEGVGHIDSPHAEDYSKVIHDNSLVLGKEGNSIRQPPNAHHDADDVKKESVSQRDPGSPVGKPAIGNGFRERAMQEEVDEHDGLSIRTTAYPKREDIELDYDPETLKRMTFQQLAHESFDTAPQPNQLANGNMSLEGGSPLSEKLRYLHALDGSREHVQSQRQAFFFSLPIDQYEECGDLMASHFSQALSKYQEARQHKRGLAREFEAEIATRQERVEKRTVAVAEDLHRLKRAGQDVVRRK
ncbi:MAG: hypothetical protein Q9169_002004 [Polycauliona sp. 2 TL-2023]